MDRFLYDNGLRHKRVKNTASAFSAPAQENVNIEKFSMSRRVFGLFGPTAQVDYGLFLSHLRRCDASFGLC